MMKSTLKIFSLLLIVSTLLTACGEDNNEPCDTITCQNGGTCVDGACECINGYTGEECETAPSSGIDGCGNETYDFGTEFGFRPNYNDIDCITQGQAYEQRVFIKNFTELQFSGQTIVVDTLRVDSLGNLPDGITYEFNKESAVYLPGEIGCVLFSGTTTDAVGDYQTDIYVYVALEVDGSRLQISAKVQKLIDDYNIPLDLKYYLRVRADGATCDDVVE